MATLKVHDKYLFLITCGQCAPDAVLGGVLTNLAALLHIALLPHQALATAAGTRGKLSYYGRAHVSCRGSLYCFKVRISPDTVMLVNNVAGKYVLNQVNQVDILYKKIRNRDIYYLFICVMWRG